MFGDQAVAAAMIDSVVHHADVLTCHGVADRWAERHLLRPYSQPSGHAAGRQFGELAVLGHQVGGSRLVGGSPPSAL